MKRRKSFAIGNWRKKENLVQINAPGVFDLPRNCLTEMLFQIIGKIMSSENLCKWRVNQFDIDNMQSCYFSFLIMYCHLNRALMLNVYLISRLFTYYLNDIKHIASIGT